MTHSTALTLAPCPFCGGAAAFVKHSAGIRGTQGFDSWDAAACRACGGTVGASDRRFRDKGDAAEAWNRRPELAAGADAGKLAEAVAWLTSGECNVGPRSEKAIATVLAALSRPAPADPAEDDLDAVTPWRLAHAFSVKASRVLEIIPHATLNQPLFSDDIARVASALAAPVSAQGDEEGDRKAAYEAMERTVNPNAAISAHGLFYAGWQARAQVAQGDEVDAARYRFLRDSPNANWRPYALRAGFHPDACDAAVDAARAQQGGQR